MANKHRGEVSIELDKVRKLKFDTNALVELEDYLGHPISKLGAQEAGIKTIVKMFQASLLHEMPNITFKEAVELMDYSTIDEVADKITQALELSLGKMDTKVKKK